MKVATIGLLDLVFEVAREQFPAANGHLENGTGRARIASGVASLPFSPIVLLADRRELLPRALSLAEPIESTAERTIRELDATEARVLGALMEKEPPR